MDKSQHGRIHLTGGITIKVLALLKCMLIFMLGVVSIVLAMLWHEYYYFKYQSECLLSLQEDYRNYIELLNDQYSEMQATLNKKKSPFGRALLQEGH